MVGFLNRNDVLIKNFGKFVDKHTERVVQHAKDYAAKFNRPYSEVKFGQRKEELAQKIADKDQITDGLVCVFWAMETGRDLPSRRMVLPHRCRNPLPLGAGACKRQPTKGRRR